MMWSLFLATSVLAAGCGDRDGCEACISGVQTFGTGAHFNCVYYEGPSAADGGECLDANSLWGKLNQDGYGNLKNTAFTQCPAKGVRSVGYHKTAAIERTGSSLDFKPARSLDFKPARSQSDMAAREARAVAKLLSLARSTPFPRDTDEPVCVDTQSPEFCASLEGIGFCDDQHSLFWYVKSICAGTCNVCQEEPAAERGANFGAPTMARSTRDSVSRLMHGLQRSNQKTSFEELAREFLAAAEAKQRGFHEKPELKW